MCSFYTATLAALALKVAAQRIDRRRIEPKHKSDLCSIPEKDLGRLGGSGVQELVLPVRYLFTEGLLKFSPICNSVDDLET